MHHIIIKKFICFLIQNKNYMHGKNKKMILIVLFFQKKIVGIQESHNAYHKHSQKKARSVKSYVGFYFILLIKYLIQSASIC